MIIATNKGKTFAIINFIIIVILRPFYFIIVDRKKLFFFICLKLYLY